MVALPEAFPSAILFFVFNQDKGRVPRAPPSDPPLVIKILIASQNHLSLGIAILVNRSLQSPRAQGNGRCRQG